MIYSLMMKNENIDQKGQKQRFHPTYCGSTDDLYFAKKWQDKGSYNYFIEGETPHSPSFINT